MTRIQTPQPGSGVIRILTFHGNARKVLKRYACRKPRTAFEFRGSLARHRDRTLASSHPPAGPCPLRQGFCVLRREKGFGHLTRNTPTFGYNEAALLSCRRRSPVIRFLPSGACDPSLLRNAQRVGNHHAQRPLARPTNFRNRRPLPCRHRAPNCAIGLITTSSPF